jgi:hypothetical protein
MGEAAGSRAKSYSSSWIVSFGRPNEKALPTPRPKRDCVRDGAGLEETGLYEPPDEEDENPKGVFHDCGDPYISTGLKVS